MMAQGDTFVIQDQLGRCRTESTAPHLCGHNQAFSVVLIFTVPRWGISVFLKTEL